MKLSSEKTLDHLYVAVVHRVTDDRRQRALGREQAHADGERLVHTIRHRLQAVAGLTPLLLRSSLGKRRENPYETPERGGVIELAVKVLVRLSKPRSTYVRACVDVHSPAEPLIARLAV